MRYITTTIDIYKFEELSKESQEKAINKLRDINVDFEWWNSTYEDAANIGLKIKSFGLDRYKEANGEFINDAFDCANKIIKEHGNMCETYKIARNFINEAKESNESLLIDDEEKEGNLEYLADEFLKDILYEYANILQKESEYLQSEEAIIETIKANDYEFTEDGKLF